MTTNVEGRLKEIESRMSGYPLVAVEDLGYALRLARLAVSQNEAMEKIREMTFWPYGLHIQDLTAVQWSQKHWTGIQAVAAEQVRAFNSATSGEGGR